MIYDCFIFSNELELLEIRLHELRNIVDKFVLVESAVTLSGLAKPLCFQDHRERFARDLHKIVHLIIPEHRMLELKDAWARERLSRDWIKNGVTDVADTDLVLVSDIDEIPRATALASCVPEAGVVAFEQVFCYYYMNLTCGMWSGTKAVSGAEWKRRQGDAQKIRYDATVAVIRDGGWHFSFYGGGEFVERKIRSYAHQELLHYANPAWIQFVLSTGCDIFQRQIDWRWANDISFLPDAVLGDMTRYGRWIPRVDFHEKWYCDRSLRILFETYLRLEKGVPGVVLDIGPWEGRSTLAIGAGSFPEVVTAIDTWRGNEREAEAHATVVAAGQRDIRAAFEKNIGALGRGNIAWVERDSSEYLRELAGPIKFAHLDGDNSYSYVRETLSLLLPKMARGGIICGNNIQAASERRQDLGGGVERAVKELLPGYVQNGNGYYWIARD